MQRIRRDLVHAFLGVFSLHHFAVPALPFVVRFESFPFVLFIESVAQVSAQYLAGGCSDRVIAELLANSFTLIARQAQGESIQDTYHLIDPSKLLNAFASSPPLFDNSSPIADAAFAFFFVSLRCHPRFAGVVAKSGRANAFISALALSAAAHFEDNMHSPILSFLLSSILCLLAVPEVAARLNDPVDGAPPHWSHADLVLVVCAKVCTEKLRVPVGRIFRALAPSLSSVASSTALAVIACFATIAGAGDRALSRWTEAFAMLVQRPSPRSPEFRAEIFAARELFVPLAGSEDARVAAAAAIVLRFVAAAGSREGARTIDISALWPADEPAARPHAGGPAASAHEWALWTRELFASTFARELKELANPAWPVRP
jgi:hypothetical protein